MAGSKQQVFYIQGADAFSDYSKFLEYLKVIPVTDLPDSEHSKRWSKTLREDLGDDFEVFMPLMPNKLNAKYVEWKIWFERHFEYLKDDITLVGWSLGGYFFSRYLIENDLPFTVKKLILIAAPFENNTSAEDGEDGGDFAFDTTKVSLIQDKVKKIEIFHSKDDFVVPYNHALKYKVALPEAGLVVFEDKNHFLIDTFPELLSSIRNQ